MVGIIILGIGALILIMYMRSQAASGPPMAVSPPPATVPTAENLVIKSLPVVGPLADYTVNKVGNQIITNKYLETHSTVGPNSGQTEASAGVAGVTVGKGVSYSTAWKDIKSANAKAQKFISSGEILKPWDW